MQKLAILTATLATLATTAPSAATAQAPTTDIEITVDGGYSPNRIEVRAGTHVRLHFTRHEYSGCTREVVFPTLGLREELPPHETVIIDLGVLPAGEHAFHCGMNMIHGVVVVLG
jgi:plastocyanin domain-containing protein